MLNNRHSINNRLGSGTPLFIEEGTVNKDARSDLYYTGVVTDLNLKRGVAPSGFSSHARMHACYHRRFKKKLLRMFFLPAPP